ncbi:hypothetical protein XENOCAPTIV_008434 [Xenoophorus captivus]|uniref:Uncharacterized protein n=1 Tax=Xenoophorus captivus TaxID=1517983 RepID=A0ABV0S5V1_9TELE
MVLRMLLVLNKSVCLRYVDHDLLPHEEFVGLYRVSETTGQAKVAADVLLRLNVPMSGLRGQTYDGQYKRVLCSLEEMAKSTSNAASTASGLFQHFSRGTTGLSLTLASAVVGELECLNISLQKKTQAVSGMQAAVNHVRSFLKRKRNDKNYLALYEKATTLVDSTESIDPIQVIHSSRFVGKAAVAYPGHSYWGGQDGTQN